MFCGKCGTKLADNVKFCGKCGTKIDSKPTNNTNNKNNTNNVGTSNLNSFIGNIVKNTEEQTKDHDIFAKIEEDDNSKNINKNLKKKKIIKFEFKLNKKAKKLNKKKVKSKPKVKPKKIKKTIVKVKKEHKKLNKKILISIVTSISVLFISIILFVYFKYGDDLLANRYVKNSLTKTFKLIDKNNKELDKFPNLVINYDSKDESNEREVYLKIQNAKGGLINEDILGSLKGLSIKTNEKYDSENSIHKTKLMILNNKNEEISGEVSSTKEVATFSFPNLYSDTLGINLVSGDTAIIDTQYHTELENSVELLSQYEFVIAEAQKSVLSKTTNLMSNIIAKLDFKLESKENNERIYTTIINNSNLLEILKTYLADFKNDENIKKVISYIIYITQNQSLDTAQASVEGYIDKLIEKLQSAIENNRVDNIVLKIGINSDKSISSIDFNTVVDGVGISTVLSLDLNDTKQLCVSDIKFTNNDSYINININSLLEMKPENNYNKQNAITIGTSFNDIIKLNLQESFDTINSIYKCDINFDVDSILENLSISYKLKGNYKQDKSLEELAIESLQLDIKNILYKFYFDFNGYIKQQSGVPVDNISLDNVIFLDNMSENDIEKIKLEIYKNGMNFLDLFSKGKW